MKKYYLIPRNGMFYICESEYKNGKTSNSYSSLKTKDSTVANGLFNQFLLEIEQPKNLVLIPEKVTLQAFYNQILPVLQVNLTKGTQKIYHYAVQNFIQILGNKPLNQYSSIDIEQYKGIRKNKVTNSTVNIDLCTLKALFNIAVSHELLEKNPFLKVKKLPVFNSQIQTIDDSQFELILKEISNPYLNKIIRFSYYSGLRIGEILSLKWKDVQENSILITSHKVHKTFFIPINERIKPILEELQKETEYLFPIRDKGYVSRTFKKIIRSIPSIPNNIHLHNLRHSFISHKITKGVPISIVQAMVNHSSIETTQRYIHISNNTVLQQYANIF